MISRNDLRDYGLLTLGGVVQAASMDLFLVPGKVASGGRFAAGYLSCSIT
jgi:hypothetical protein